MGKTNFPPFALLNTNPPLLICTVQRMYLSHGDMKDMTGETDERYKCEKVPSPQTWVHVHSWKKIQAILPSPYWQLRPECKNRSRKEGRRGKSEKRSPSSDQPTDLKISLFICGTADRSGRGKRCSSSCCCCCWGGTIFQSPMYSFLGCENAKTLSQKGVKMQKLCQKYYFPRRRSVKVFLSC